MAHRRTLALTDTQIQALQHHRDHDPRAYVRERCAAMLKIAAGKSPYWVACNGLLKARDPDSVYSWLTAYQSDGLAGIIAHPVGGYRGRHL